MGVEFPGEPLKPSVPAEDPTIALPLERRK